MFKKHHLEAEHHLLMAGLIVAMALAFFLLGKIFGFTGGTGKQATVPNQSQIDPADLVVERVSLNPSSVPLDGTTVVTYMIANHGQANVSRPFSVSFIDQYDNRERSISNPVTIDGLNAGASIQKSLSVPGEYLIQTVGVHRIYIKVDPSNQIVESNNNNNNNNAMLTVTESRLPM